MCRATRSSRLPGLSTQPKVQTVLFGTTVNTCTVTQPSTAHQRCHVTSMAVLNAWTSVSSLPAMYVLGLRSVSLPLVALNLPQQYWYDTDQKC